MTGQAESAPETEGLAELASFLSDTPEEESEDEKVEASSEETTAESDQVEAEDDPQVDADEEETPEEPAPDRKIKVTVKGDDGSETTEEVPETELVKGYQRQADYTRKTQALAQRENQAVEVFTNKFEEVRTHYVQQAELARSVVAQIAGIRSDEEMAQLASSDPAAWVAENQRKQSLQNILSQLDSKISSERQQAEAAARQRQEKAVEAAYQRTWAELSKAGIDKPTLTNIYSAIITKYGFTAEELGSVYDPRIVKMMKDANAYQSLVSKKGEVTKKAADAPRLPSKQSAPANERKQQELNAKFKSGRAKLSDLAAYLPT